MNVVLQHPNALQAENLMAYDNAVSALGKICVFHRDSIDAAQVLKTFLVHIPKGSFIILVSFLRHWLANYGLSPGFVFLI